MGEQVISAYADRCNRNCFSLGMLKYGLRKDVDSIEKACNTVPGCYLTYESETRDILAADRAGDLTEQEAK